MFFNDVNNYYLKHSHDFNIRIDIPKNRIGSKDNLFLGECFGLDINLCYWTTVFNLGFISEKTYKRGIFFRNANLDDALNFGFIGKRNYKKAKKLNYSYKEAYENGLIKEEKYVMSMKNIKIDLNRCIGSLTKTILIKEYKNGNVIEYIDDQYLHKYRPFYRRVLEIVESLMLELSKVKGFLFFETDCVYFNKNKEEILLILEKYNYCFKEVKINILENNLEKIVFFDYKLNKIRKFKK